MLYMLHRVFKINKEQKSRRKTVFWLNWNVCFAHMWFEKPPLALSTKQTGVDLREDAECCGVQSQRLRFALLLSVVFWRRKFPNWYSESSLDGCRGRVLVGLSERLSACLVRLCCLVAACFYFILWSKHFTCHRCHLLFSLIPPRFLHSLSNNVHLQKTEMQERLQTHPLFTF